MSEALAQVDLAVAQAEAELDKEVWIAVRVSSKGNVAFMGAFDTREHAMERCQHNKDQELVWSRRSQVVPEWETDWMNWMESVRVRFSVALRPIQDNGDPIMLNGKSAP